MRRNSFILAFLIVFGAFRHGATAQEVEPGTIPWTPLIDTGLVRASITVPPQFAGLGLDPSKHFLMLPPGWSASVFYAGSALNKARFMSWGPDSVLYVANMSRNNILALPDVDRNGIADDAVVATTASAMCHDVKFYRDTMYMCSESGVTRAWRPSDQGYSYSFREVLIDKSSQPGQTGGNHRTRTLVLDTVHRKIYISVGSSGNADRESTRALVEQYEWDGSGRRTFATGIRNAVGLTLHPRTGQLWGTNNGSDLQGNNVPPEWVDIIRDGGFYGYPFAYHHQIYVDFTKNGFGDLLPITAGDSALVKSMVPPAALVWAHCAPMALEFAHDDMTAPYNKGAFVVLRGSWNRQPASGAKIVFLEFDDDSDTIANAVREFCTGFIVDSTDLSTRWARPVGLALARDGSVYVTSDDLKQCILKLTPPPVTSVREGADQGSLEIRIQPNPARDTFSVSTPRSDDLLKVEVVDAEGRIVVRTEGIGTVDVQAGALAAGQYYVKATGSRGSATRKVNLLK